jgi:hypothetical protein
MPQFKSKSGIKIVPPVPTRAASAFRAPAPKERKNAAHGASRGEQPRTHRTSPGGAKETPFESNIGHAGTKSEAATFRRNPGAPFLAPLARSGEISPTSARTEKERNREGTTSVVPPSSRNVPGFSRGAAQECSPRRKPWGHRHKSQPSPGGAEETPFESNVGPCGNKIGSRHVEEKPGCPVSRVLCEKRGSSPTSTRTGKERNREGHDFSHAAKYQLCRTMRFGEPSANCETDDGKRSGKTGIV